MVDTWKFYREPDGWIEATPEKWQWVAFYSDGSVLKQFDDEGVFHQFKEIDQENLRSFSMISSGKPPITLGFKPGMKLIHFYRNIQVWTGEDAQFIRLYCFGYQRGPEKIMMAIMPDDSLLIVNDIDEIEIV